MDEKVLITKINDCLKGCSYEDLKLVFVFMEGYLRKRGKTKPKGDT